MQTLSQEKKMKKDSRAAVLVLFLAVLPFCLISCSPSPSTQGEPAAVPAETTPAASTPAPESSGGWPKGIPGIIPPFTFGVSGTQDEPLELPTQTVCTLGYDKVTMENVREYLARLKEKGFSMEENKSVKAGEFSAIGLLSQGERVIASYTLNLQGSWLDLRFVIYKK
jgi:hypothetical protein